jgi:tRNA threonylcarbamoyl adenosine modification protein YeaZ
MVSLPITLALELSQREGSIALSQACGTIALKTVETGKRHKDDVLPTIANLAEELSIESNKIQLVVVSVGPGGFTGLRTAVSIAKMISLTTGAEIVSVETALSITRSQTTNDGTYYVVSGVKKETFWLSKVTNHKDDWKCESHLSTLDAFQKVLGSADGVFIDSYSPDEVAVLCSERDVSIYQARPDAKSLLELGTMLFKQKATIDPMNLAPLYPREPEAVRLWKTKNKS